MYDVGNRKVREWLLIENRPRHGFGRATAGAWWEAHYGEDTIYQRHAFEPEKRVALVWAKHVTGL